MEHIDLVESEVLGFKFKNGPGFADRMNYYIGKTGKIVSHYKDSCVVKFSDGKKWSYPYPEILDHLVKEKTLDELFDNIKSVINTCKNK